MQNTDGKAVQVGAIDQGNGTYALLQARGAKVVSPAGQASANAYADVAGSTLDTLNAQFVSYTLVNTGANTLTWKVLGANNPDFSDVQQVQAPADVLAAGVASYSGSAVWRYYKVQVVSKVADTPGSAVVRGIAKG
jgi:hypothetical protein